MRYRAHAARDVGQQFRAFGVLSYSRPLWRARMNSGCHSSATHMYHDMRLCRVLILNARSASLCLPSFLLLHVPVFAASPVLPHVYRGGVNLGPYGGTLTRGVTYWKN